MVDGSLWLSTPAYGAFVCSIWHEELKRPRLGICSGFENWRHLPVRFHRWCPQENHPLQGLGSPNGNRRDVVPEKPQLVCLASFSQTQETRWEPKRRNLVCQSAWGCICYLLSLCTQTRKKHSRNGWINLSVLCQYLGGNSILEELKNCPCFTNEVFTEPEVWLHM